MENTLGDFLRAYGAKPRIPLFVDCAALLAGWAIWLGYPDPAAGVREQISDVDGFNALVKARGGLVPVVDACLAEIGVRRTSRIEIGAGAVIGSAANPQHQYCALFDGRRWQVRYHDRIGPLNASPLAIWEF